MKIFNAIILSFSVLLFVGCSSQGGDERRKESIESLSLDTVVSDKVDSKSDLDSIEVDDISEDSLLNLTSQGLVEVLDVDPTIIIDLKYATSDNFTKQILYSNLRKAYLQPLAAQKLKKAQQLLKEYDPNLSLLVYDAARPLSVQRVMYDAVKNTKYHLYVAHPSRTSLHNYGIAVDLTICDENREPLDMGTAFDYFGKEAGIYREAEFVKNGLLTEQQVNNRKLLRKVMLDAGFQTIRGEWWHFNACSLAEAKQQFKIIE